MRLPCTSNDAHAYFVRSKRSLRVGQRAYFGRSKTTLFKIFTMRPTDADNWQEPPKKELKLRGRQIPLKRLEFYIYKGLMIILFLEHEVNGKHQANKRCQMIPFQFHLKGDYRKYGKHHQGYHLLNHFELHYIERTSILTESQTVGGDLQTILKESDAPTKRYDCNKRKCRKPTKLFTHFKARVF